MNNSNQNIELIDSHCHLHMLDLDDFSGTLENVFQKAFENNVHKMLCVCTELEEIPKIKEIAANNPNVYTSVGIHPNVILEKEYNADELIALANYESCIAIGETGLDYYRSTGDEIISAQHYRFREHIKASKKCTKPLIIHTRNAKEDTLAIMREESAGDIGGVMHCFAEDWEFAKKALDLGFYISFSGIVTFKNAKELKVVAEKVPADKMLIETDCPFLAPTPFRGKQNHPALVYHVARELALLRGTTLENIAKTTTENFYKCFFPSS